jgi:hypothetical protein
MQTHAQSAVGAGDFALAAHHSGIAKDPTVTVRFTRPLSHAAGTMAAALSMSATPVRAALRLDIRARV